MVKKLLWAQKGAGRFVIFGSERLYLIAPNASVADDCFVYFDSQRLVISKPARRLERTSWKFSVGKGHVVMPLLGKGERLYSRICR